MSTDVNNAESTIQQHIQIQAKHFNCTLLRNNSGALKDHTGRVVRFGLGNVSKKIQDNFKSSDLIGITQVVITPDMVGKTIGVFTALEVKKAGWKNNKKLDARETAQNNFLQWVLSKGGIAAFINSVDQLAGVFKR